jgi:hypothetical protein
MMRIPCTMKHEARTMKNKTTFALTPQEEARLRRLFIAASKETKAKPRVAIATHGKRKEVKA